MRIYVALNILEEKWLSGEISTEEYTWRQLAICVWAKRRIFNQIFKRS